MLLRKFGRDPKILLRVGMCCLLAGSFSLYFLPRIKLVPTQLADGMVGLFYGLAIGTLLWSARAGRRGRHGATE
jgi:hypothetical protein